MARVVETRELNESFQAIDPEEGDLGTSPEPEVEEPPVVIFLIPGIRSDSIWAHNFRITTKSYLRKPIEFRIVSGPSRLTLFRLVSRFRLHEFRKYYKSQILDVCRRFPSSEINFVCHSMGSSLFSEIIDDLSKEAAFRSANDVCRVKNIVFLGSVCHVSMSERLRNSSVRFVNDVGTNDILPFMASTINAFKYGMVGTFGFSNCYVIDRFFPNDHTSCTGKTHLIDKVMPLIEEDLVAEPQIPEERFNLTTFIYLRRIFWILIVVLLLAIVWSVA